MTFFGFYNAVKARSFSTEKSGKKLKIKKKTYSIAPIKSRL